jgi:ATP-dependent Clp protease ATP-binding subunit ClpC
MPTYRYPVLVWEDVEGYLNACPVESNEPVGLGRTTAEALRQVEEGLVWSFENGWRPTPDWDEPRLGWFRLSIRPQYPTDDGRPFPCEEAFVLRLPFVRGRQRGGLLACSLPTIGVRFVHAESDSLDELIDRAARRVLEGLTPRELARHLTPRRVELAQVVVRVDPRGARRAEAPELPALEAVAEPLGERGRGNRPARAWGRDAEVADLVGRLGQGRSNVLIVGEAGSGKSAVLLQAIRSVDPDRGPDDAEGAAMPRTRRFWLTSAGRLIAGMMYLGQWEERCEALFAELAGFGGILCVEGLLDLVRTGGSAASNGLAAFFVPYLQRGELRMIAEATPDELDACRRLLPGLADLFQVLALPALSPAQSLGVLDDVAASTARELGLDVDARAVGLVDRLFRRFAPDLAMPGKAPAFLADALEQAARDGEPGLTPERVVARFVARTGLPELFLRDDMPLDVPDVAAALAARVIGQDEACRIVAEVVTTFKAGLNDPGRPPGVLLFVGPTGVGKTELAKALAAFCFGHGEQPDRLVRLDMSEYALPGSADRLLTRHDGEPSDLVRKVRQQPFAVVLFDEIEKADSGVFDLLMGVCDEGRLTDRFGRTASFRSALVVMTSNLGTRPGGPIGFVDGAAVATGQADEALRFFRPEFANRIDAVVSFRPLDSASARAIVAKELAELARREGLARAGLRLSWTGPAVDALARAGTDDRHGARPLQRALETMVVAPLARHLLARPGLRDAEVRIDFDPRGRIEFTQVAR